MAERNDPEVDAAAVLDGWNATPCEAPEPLAPTALIEAGFGEPQADPGPLEPRRCNAWNKGRARRCLSTLVMANGRCRQHGGLTPAGIASRNFRHGKRSRLLKDVPGDWQRDMRDALADPELTRLQAELALTDARTGALLRRLKADGIPPATWSELRRLLIAFQATLADGRG
jgi:hypothetical protein